MLRLPETVRAGLTKLNLSLKPILNASLRAGALALLNLLFTEVK